MRLLVILLIALSLRLPLLNDSLWLDEAAQALESIRPISQQFQLQQDFQPPLFHLWLHFFTYFSQSEWWLRLSTLIPGVLTVYATHYLAYRVTRSARQSLLPALILATSQFHIFYSQELRPYALAGLWGVVAVYYFLQLPNRKSRLHWPFILSLTLGLYTTYTFFFLYLALLTTSLIKHHPTSKIIIHFFLPLLAFLPWLPALLTQFQQALFIQTQTPNWTTAVSLPILKSLPLLFTKLLIGNLNFDVNLTTLILSSFSVISFGWLIIQSRYTIKHQPLTTIILFTVLFSFATHLFLPILEPKRLLFLLPLIIVLLLTSVSPHKLKSVALIGILLLNLTSLVVYWTKPVNQRENWRTVIHHIESTAPADTAIIVSFPESFAPLTWYQTRPIPIFPTGTLQLTSVNLLDQPFRGLTSHNTVYIFEYLMDLTDPHRFTYQWLNSHGYRQISFNQYPKIGKISVYQFQDTFALSPITQ